MRSLFALVLFCATTALAQPQLLKDIRTTGPIDGSSSPKNFLTFGSSLYFTAWGRESGGVWRLDKTTNAPVQVMTMAGITAMTSLRGRLLVAGYAGLATTDGTPGSTKQVSTTTVSSGPLLEASGRALFVHATNELWSTDGTTDGTQKIDFHPQASPLQVALLGAFGGRVVFVSDYGVAITDGTAAGTTTLTPVVREAGNVVAAGDRFFFAGRHSDATVDLWVSDGSPGGTHATKRLSNLGALSSTGAPIAAIGNNRVVYWTSNGHGTSLCVTDGTDAGRIEVANVFNTGYLCVVLNGIVYFSGSEQVNGTAGTLWRTDGTAAATRAVAALPDPALGQMNIALGRIWMTTYGPPPHLSVSDGTSIRVLASLVPSQSIAEFSGRAYFSAYDDAHGWELWSSDATPEGTAIFADLEPNIAPSSYPKPILASAAHLLFTATDNSNTTQTWTSDGAPDETRVFPFKIWGAARFGDLLYFTPDDKRKDLYRTDGTEAGTQKIYTFPADAAPVAATRDLLYINAGGSLWASDGTAEGTALAAKDSGVPSSAIDVGGRLVFGDYYGSLYEVNGRQKPQLVATNSGHLLMAAGGRMFSSRSTPGGFVLLVDGVRQIATFSGIGPFPFGAIDGRFLFGSGDNTHGLEVWASDGTPEGTKLVTNLGVGPVGWILSNGNHAVVNDRVLFVTYDATTYVRRLWSSDGTAAGTFMLPAAGASNDFVVVKGLAFFSATDPLHGNELWQTDGTPEGTQLAGDVDAGPRSSDPANMFPARDTLFFTATTLDTGREMWALPVPGRTIAIDDTHASYGATTATMTIALDGPSTQPVTASWSSTTGASGTLQFAPGERAKTITFAITPDPTTRSSRFEHVRLADVRGAIATKRFGTVIEDGPPPVGDLSLSIGPSSADNRQRSIIVTNHGPDTVVQSTITYSTTSYYPNAAYTTLVSSLAPGASISAPFTIQGFFSATVSSPTPDPDPTNNSLLVAGAMAYSAGLSISLAPPVLHPAEHATLTIGTSSGPVTLTSSNPSVMSVPATASSGNVDVVALAPGRATITASIGSFGQSIDVGVAAAGTSYRWPSQMTFTIDGDLAFGAPLHLMAKIPAFAWDANATPTGPVTFYDGDRVLAVAYVNRSSFADTIVASLLPGPHTINATYAGDTHFLGTTAPPQTVTILKPPPVTFYGTSSPRKDGNTDVTIVAVAPQARPATGTITLKNYDEVLASSVTFVGSATVTTKRVSFVTVYYSGDELYDPAVVGVQLAPVRHRAAP